MTEDQYTSLCKYCDSILVAKDSTFERVAIPWLHIIREHPVFLRQYEGIFLPMPSIMRVLFYYLQFRLFYYANILRAVWHFFRSSRKNWHGRLPSGTPVDFVFVSHLVNPSQLSGEEDFYFGKVPAELIRQGKSVLLILIQHDTIPVDNIERYLEVSTIPRIVISNVLSPRDELHISKSTIKEAKRLKSAASSETIDLRRTILKKASIEATSSSTRTSLRIARIVGEIISHCQAKRVVTTYEGHAFERVVYAASRESSPGIFCIGYQHAALFRLQHAARRSIGMKYDPDQILCAGPVGFRQLQEGRRMNHVSLGILGSNRCLNVLPDRTTATCLVLPEGIESECMKLFSFSLLCAVACPEIKFVWRLHPILLINKIKDQLKVFGKKMPNNIEISTKLFSKDIARSSWALYRGSTAIISASSNNVIPIYLYQENELSVDPLYEIQSYRPSVNSVNEFIESLKWSKWTNEAVIYCRDYYSAFNKDTILQKENLDKDIA